MRISMIVGTWAAARRQIRRNPSTQCAVSLEESNKSRLSRVTNWGRPGRELLALKMQQEKLSRSDR